jgi:anti-sigma factor RsiW
MCEVQGKLVAWLDRELPADEAAHLERHIEGCEECRGRLAAYKQVSETFDGYCDVAARVKARRRISGWVPVLTAAAVAAVVIFLAVPRTRMEPPAILTPAIMAVSVPVPAPPAPEPAPHKKILKRRVVRAVQKQAAKWQPTETAVQIAIPAEAMFPPGAVPKGLNFVAELSIAADGSVKQVRLRQ